MFDVFHPNVWVLINYYLLCLRVLLTDLGAFSCLAELPVSVTGECHKVSTPVHKLCALGNSLGIKTHT